VFEFAASLSAQPTDQEFASGTHPRSAILEYNLHDMNNILRKGRHSISMVWMATLAWRSLSTSSRTLHIGSRAAAPLIQQITDNRLALRQALPFLIQPVSSWGTVKCDSLAVLRRSPPTCEEGAGAMELGVLTLPPLHTGLIQGPTGYRWMYLKGMKIVLDQQRMTLINEFVESMEVGEGPPPREYGVLLSGSEGAGKSAICFLTFLVCFARGLPVTYIPAADIWVSGGETEMEAQAFFMREFFRHNADLMVDACSPSSELRPYFEDQLSDTPIRPNSYTDFASDLSDGKISFPCGFIVDRVQTMTEAAERIEYLPVPGKTYYMEGHSIYEDHFLQDFTVWSGPSRAFCSQLTGTVYAQRELDLRMKSEDHRLRLVHPMQPDDVKVLLNCEESPFFASKTLAASSDRIIELTGCMPRSIDNLAMMAREADDIHDSAAIDRKLEQFEWSEVHKRDEIATERWWQHIPDESRDAAAEQILRILKREEPFSHDIRSLYDYGIVHRTASIGIVYPISRPVETALHLIYGRHMESRAIRISDDYTFKKQVRVAIHRKNGGPIEGYSFRYPRRPALCTSCVADMVYYFNDVSEIKPHPRCDILWINMDDNFICDGIVVPPAGTISEDKPVQIIHASVLNPFSAVRLEAVKASSRWREDTLAKQLGIVAEHHIYTFVFYHEAVSNEDRDHTQLRPALPVNTFWVDKSWVRGIRESTRRSPI
jgi:hypothetical protein